MQLVRTKSVPPTEKYDTLTHGKGKKRVTGYRSVSLVEMGSPHLFQETDNNERIMRRYMPKKKEWQQNMHGSQLLARGEVIQFIDKGELLQCRVLSCLAVEGWSVYASLEVTVGERKGERIEAMLRAGKPPEETGA